MARGNGETYRLEDGKMNFPILDHGYIKLIESWGSDERIIESARMSTDGAFRGWGPDENGKPGDEKLLRYLWENKHTSPFEMAGLTLEVQAPILVFRQWQRHRTQAYNELSARYAVLPDMFYVPTAERLIASSNKNANKQASGGGTVLTPEQADEVRRRRIEHQRQVREHYEWELSLGIAPELARCEMPVSQYSRMRASASLLNWLKFETLRYDAHAQYEIFVYGEALGKLIEQVVPRTWGLWSEGK